jgi:cystathionine beta-lyase
MTPYDFDAVIDRRNTGSEKWDHYDSDVIPLWVADMDFRSPEPVIEAVHRRVEQGIFGYSSGSSALHEVLAERMRRLYGWTVKPDAIVLLPGVIPGFNLACRALCQPHDAVVVFPPVYPPMLRAPANAGLDRIDVPLRCRPDLHYTPDFDGLAAALTPQARMLMLCNPHNPVGRVLLRDELQRLANICLRHDLYICSDEIHCDLLFSRQAHIPIASLSPEIEARAVTVMAPSKTFNIPGLKLAFAVIPDATLRARFEAARADLVSEPNILGQVAALAAYEDGEEWLRQCLAYLEVNRDYLVDFVRRDLPHVRLSVPEGTYLAWLDCRGLDLLNGPYRFFLDQARVALGDGARFGAGGDGFVRLNFGCPRSLLVEGLNRMAAALEARGARR